MDINYVKNAGEELFQAMVDTRRHLHMHPEIGLAEFETQKYIMDFLDKEGIAFKKIAQTGIVAEVYGKKNGNVVALRADIDALPIVEKNEHDFCSLNNGLMHACGHDVHTAVNMACAKFFNDNKDNFEGIVKFFFQPAEENFGGAKLMINEGCLENPKVDYAIGFHVMPYLPYDKLEFKHDTLNASTNTFEIKVIGKSSHGAYPDLGVDAIVVASQIVVALQSIVSRNVSPLESAVVTVGSIHGGTASNIITEEVKLVGTVRVSTPSLRASTIERVVTIANGIANAMGARCEITFDDDGYAPLVNHNDILDLIINTTKEALGESAVTMKKFASMGGEDFSFFIENTKGAFYSVGCKVPDKEAVSLHTACFDVDERCMKTAFVIEVCSALKLLELNKK